MTPITSLTVVLFTPDPAEYSTTLSLKLNNQTLPTTKHPKILGITLDSKLTFSQHISVTITKANHYSVEKAVRSSRGNPRVGSRSASMGD